MASRLSIVKIVSMDKPRKREGVAKILDKKGILARIAKLAKTIHTQMAKYKTPWCT